MDGTGEQTLTCDVSHSDPVRAEAIVQRTCPPTAMMIDTSLLQSLAAVAAVARQLRRSVLTPLRRATSNMTGMSAMLDDLHELLKLTRILPATMFAECERWHLRRRVDPHSSAISIALTAFLDAALSSWHLASHWSLLTALAVHRSVVREIKRKISCLIKFCTQREIRRAEVLAASLKRKSSLSTSCINPIRAPEVPANILARISTHSPRSNSCLTRPTTCGRPTSTHQQSTSVL